jgi:hypothetical protein
MKGYNLPVIQDTDRAKNLMASFRNFLDEKGLLNFTTFALALAMSAAAVYPMYGELGYKAGLLTIVGILAFPIILICLFNLQLGVIIVLGLSFVLLGIKRFLGDVPIGTAMDGLISVMLAGLFIKLVLERKIVFGSNPVSIMLLLWFFYNFLQVLNPYAESREAWMYTVRGIGFFIVLYFIITKAITSVKVVKMLIWSWLIMAVIAALYGLKQEYFGFFQAETIWINADQERFNLLFIHGRFRKFSFFSDPMVFGFVCAYTGMMCLALMIGTFKPITKIVLGVFFFIFMLAMFASGTRSAFVMIPAGIAFFALITFKRWIVISAIGGFILLVIVVLMPTVNNAHFRVKTAFQPQTDDSYQVRAKNQKRIQPFIQQHPMGGGLGSVGVWGKKFTPYSMLANFPPDSGYMRVAVEAGWIGLALYLSMLFVAMKTGIQNYFRMKDPELRSYMLATLITFFVLILANFPQEAIIQLPTNVIFFIVMALLTKLKTLEEERTLETNVARQ